MRNDYIQKLYEKNPDTGNYIIKISLDKYTDVFNDWDNYSYKKRDVDPDLAFFIEDCSDDIPLKHGIDITFTLPKEMKNENREKIITTGIRTYYSFYTNYQYKILREEYKKTISYILISCTFLTLGFFFRGLSFKNIFYSTFLEGLNIGDGYCSGKQYQLFFLKEGK